MTLPSIEYGAQNKILLVFLIFLAAVRPIIFVRLNLACLHYTDFPVIRAASSSLRCIPILNFKR